MPLVRALGTIIIDGDPSDWTALGLTPAGTDPPYNIKSYHDICADLLEAWVYHDVDNLYLMIKVRGGYPADWDRNSYLIALDTDMNKSTGDQLGNDYGVAGSDALGALLVWNETTLSWNGKAQVEMKAGNTGYIEWRVPFSEISTTGQGDITVASYDDILKETVNTIFLDNIVIPEFSMPFLLVVPATATLVFAVYRRKTRKLSDCNYELFVNFRLWFSSFIS